MGYLLTLFSNGPKMLTTMELRGWCKGALWIIFATTKKLKLCQNKGYNTPQTVSHRQRFKSLAGLHCASQGRLDVSFWFNLRSAPYRAWLSTQQRVPLFSSWWTPLPLRVEPKHPLPICLNTFLISLPPGRATPFSAARYSLLPPKVILLFPQAHLQYYTAVICVSLSVSLTRLHSSERRCSNGSALLLFLSPAPTPVPGTSQMLWMVLGHNVEDPGPWNWMIYEWTVLCHSLIA